MRVRRLHIQTLASISCSCEVQRTFAGLHEYVTEESSRVHIFGVERCDIAVGHKVGDAVRWWWLQPKLLHIIQRRSISVSIDVIKKIHLKLYTK